MPPESIPLAGLMRQYAASLRLHLIDDESAVRAFENFQEAEEFDLACDFTEIHAYCNIFSSRNISYTHSSNAEKQVALNEALLEELFFSGRFIYLLPSYKIELSNFERNIANDSFGEISKAADEVRRQRKNPRSIGEIAEEALKRIGKAVEIDPITFLSKIYESAPVLMLLLKSDLRPRQRLDFLRSHASFKSVGDDPRFASANVKPLDSTVLWWQHELELKRPDTPRSSNVIDAVALARIQSINSIKKLKKPVVLVTRSNAMREILASNVNKKECKNIYIVHPRMMGLYKIARKDARPFRTAIVNRYWLLRDALDRIEQVGFDHDYFKYPELTFLLKRVQRLWDECDDLTVASSVWNQISNYGSINKSGTETLELIKKYVGSQTTVREVLLERASEIASDLAVSNAEIAAISVMEEADRNLIVSIEKKTDPKKLTAAYNLKFPSTDIPYSLQIYSSELFEADTNSDDAVSMLGKFIQRKNLHSEYEQRVAMSYLLASLGAWELALSFANLAIEVPDLNIPKHEAYYYRALARRYTTKEPKIDDVALAVDDIIKANSIKQEIRGKNYWDPRYLNECGVLSAYHETYFSKSKIFTGLLDQGPLKIWQDTLSRIKDDIDLSIIVRNNMLYYSINKNDTANVGYLYDQIQNLIKLKKYSMIPASTRHTIEMAKLHLAKSRKFDILQIKKALELLASEDFRDDYLREVIYRDINLVNQKIESSYKI